LPVLKQDFSPASIFPEFIITTLGSLQDTTTLSKLKS